MIDLSVINLINHKLIINLSNSINWKSSKCKNSSTSFPSLYCCSPWPTPNKSVCNKNVQLSSKLVTKLAKTNLPPALFSALLEVKDACKTASQEASQPSIFCTAASTNASIFDLYFVYFIHFSFEYTCLNSMDSFDSFDLFLFFWALLVKDDSDLIDIISSLSIVTLKSLLLGKFLNNLISSKVPF